MTAKEMEQAARRKIRQLRKQKHKLGRPFMINTDDLPSDQCYLEFPDGSIKIAKAGVADFIIIGELDYLKAKMLKQELNLA